MVLFIKILFLNRGSLKYFFTFIFDNSELISTFNSINIYFEYSSGLIETNSQKTSSPKNTNSLIRIKELNINLIEQSFSYRRILGSEKTK